jgi:putative transposase
MAPTGETKRVTTRRPRKGEQLTLAKTGGWGGKRKNAGRKRSGTRSRVVHAKRPVHKGRHPVHVTLRAKAGLPSFRQQLLHKLLAGILSRQRHRKYKDDFRVLHFSIQGNHLHLVVEADSENGRGGYQPLRSGISGLEIAFARRLNMLLKRKGKVWDDRYHRHDLTSPREVSHGFGYLFNNYTHHGERSYGDGVLDFHCSAWLFEGWSGPHVIFGEIDWWPICPAKTWLASEGYLTHGRLTIKPHHPTDGTSI